jgi:enterochelin esterase-like enzyme
MYLLHGIGGTHTEWLGGNPNEILSNLFPDNLKLSGNSDYKCLSGKELANSLPDKPKSKEYNKLRKAKPMIVVMPNVRAMKNDSVPSNPFGEESVAAFHNFINDLQNDLMPFISSKYPVADTRDQRAIAGLSMGGMESLHIGVRLPNVFGYTGAFSSAPTLPLTPEQMKLPDEYMESTFIMICCGEQDGLIAQSVNYNKWLVDNGVRTAYYTIPGGHDFGVWKNGLYYFAQCIF